MPTASGNKDQYNEMAAEYNDYAKLPMARLEAELIRRALGDCTGLTVLDLGGGSGVHARQAVKAGARRVDVVDISDAMLQIGRDIEAQSSDESRIRWLLADASKPLAEQGIDAPVGEYDVAMANWVFDHAHNPEDLGGMWTNIATTLKPGGRFIGIRIHIGQPTGSTEVATKYGCSLTEFKDIPGGIGCTATLLTSPPFSFGATLMEDSYTLANEVPKRLGMVDFEVVPYADASVIGEDPDFWQDYVDAPFFLVLTAKKA